ncbi:MAG: allantoinase AllB [Nocardioidaceae bacterium]|nr:allantoinase AllB [Nocardioidaceae bacterium]
MDVDVVFRAQYATADGVAAGDVAVRGGRIVAIAPDDAGYGAARVVRLADDEVLLPGLVDTHVHVNEPGRTEWEGFASATKAAAAGGVTTVVDMPLNSIPPTIDLAALGAKRAAAAGQLHVDVGFWGGAVPSSLGHLRGLHDAGVFGFKCFLLHSGVDEFPPLEPSEVDAAMREVAAFDGLLIVHAEDARRIAEAPRCHGARYADFLASRPHGAEVDAIAGLLELAAKHGTRLHILHVSSADAVSMLGEARSRRVRVTAETCPHYLTLTAEEVADGQTEFKCCPPIRDDANRERLWQALGEGRLQAVVSDHSPSSPELKCLDTGDFGKAWGGISSLQLGFALVWSEARRRGHHVHDVARWMAASPALIAGVEHKGKIAAGFDADFAVVAPDATFTVDPTRLHHRHPVTPYAGRQLHGVVRQTWLRGHQIAAMGDMITGASGQLLSRGGRPNA